ncbi:MAG: hypothetical protein L6R28_05285 [Planctomycetes bacterium]|nr:hypothetical protein [Planctomycetota bacterium]
MAYVGGRARAARELAAPAIKFRYLAGLAIMVLVAIIYVVGDYFFKEEPVAQKPPAVAPPPDDREGRPAVGNEPPPGPRQNAAPSLASAAEQVTERFSMPVGSRDEAMGRLDELIKIFESDSLPEKKAAYRALLAMKEQIAGEMPAELAKAKPKVLPWIAQACGEWRLQAAARPLIKIADKEGAKAGYEVFRAIGDIGDRDCRNYALRLLKDKDIRLRGMGWEAFAKCPTAADLEFLYAGIEKGDAIEKKWSRVALGKLADDADVQAKILERLAKDLAAREGKAKLPFVETMGEFPPLVIQDQLTPLLSDPEPALRAAAVRGLGRHEIVVQRLNFNFQQEQDPAVLRVYLKAYANYPEYEVIPHIMKIFTDRKFSMGDRMLAKDALVAAFGVDQGRHAESWSNWLATGEPEGDRGRRTVFTKERERRRREREAAGSP